MAHFIHKAFIETQPCPFIYLLSMLLSYYNGAAELFWQSSCGLQSLNYLLSRSLQKKFANSYKNTSAFQIRVHNLSWSCLFLFCFSPYGPPAAPGKPSGETASREWFQCAKEELGCSFIPEVHWSVWSFCKIAEIFYVLKSKDTLSEFDYFFLIWLPNDVLMFTWKCHISFQLMEQKANKMTVVN